MMRLLTGGLLVVVLAGTVLVAAGIGQGSPPPRLPIAGRAAVREIKAVKKGGAVVRAGERLFDSHGCSSCHTMASDGYAGRIGPRLDVQSQGNPVAEIEGKIANPPTGDVGYQAHLMPENFGERLSGHDIHALAVYVHAAARAASGKSRHRRRRSKRH